MDVLKEVKEVYDRHHKSIVLILNDDGVGTTVGTGFIIHQEANRCLVMTCQHVIAQGQKIHVRLAGPSSEYVAMIIHEHEESDLAILKIDMDVMQQSLRFRETSWDVGVDERVFLAAYYHPDMMASLTNIVCLSPTVMPGKICASLGECEANPQFNEIAHSCRSQGGCSGGPSIYDSVAIGVHSLCQTQVEYASSVETVKAVMQVQLARALPPPGVYLQFFGFWDKQSNVFIGAGNVWS